MKLSEYENMYPVITPLVIPLASTKSASLSIALSTLKTILDNGDDQAISFIFDPSNVGFIEFIKSIISECDLLSVDAIRLCESISMFDEIGPSLLATSGIIVMLFEMLQCDDSSILSAIFSFFEGLSRTTTNPDEILDLFKTIDIYEYCSRHVISVKWNMIYMYLAYLRIGSKEYILEMMTPEVIELCFELAKCDKKMESVVKISFLAFLDRSESEEFNNMVEEISCDQNFELMV